MAAAIVFPALEADRRRQQQLAARADIRALLEAGNQFFEEYGVWPSEHSGQYGDFRYGRGDPNRYVMNPLLARDGAGNPGHAINRRRIVFLEAPAWRPGYSGITTAGDFLDPWGQPYQVVMDTDLDNLCDMRNSIYGLIPDCGMAVWSCGPDRVSDTADDLRSWPR